METIKWLSNTSLTTLRLGHYHLRTSCGPGSDGLSPCPHGVQQRDRHGNRLQSRWSMFSLSASTDMHMAPVILVDVEAQSSPLVHMCMLLDHHCFCHECWLPISWCAPPTAMTLGFSLVSFSPSMLYYPGKFPRPLKTSLTRLLSEPSGFPGRVLSYIPRAVPITENCILLFH